MKTQEDARIALVKDILRYLAKHGAYLTTSRCQKLLYLIERQCIIDAGERCLELEYRYDKFGMYSPTVNRIFREVEPNRDDLKLMSLKSERGSGRTIVWVGGDAEVRLAPEIEDATLRVLQLYGYLSTPNLVAFAKTTSPFIHCRKGEFLDWEVLREEVCRKGEELSEEGRKRLEDSWRAIQAGRSLEFEDIESFMADLFAS